MYKDDNIKKVVLDVLDSGWLINGPISKEFEKKLTLFHYPF